MKFEVLGAGRSEELISNGKSRTPNGSPELNLISAMIVQAIKEMRTGRQTRRYSVNGERQRSGESMIGATVWLASLQARPWFDLVGVEQRYALEGMGWCQHARALLDNDESDMTANEIEVLSGGVEVLGCESS